MQRQVSPQVFTCDRCQQTWSRPPARGHRPRFCPTCRALPKPTSERKTQRACEYCGESALMYSDQRFCSRRCSRVQPPRTAIRWTSCTNCLQTFMARHMHAFETCSAACAEEARLVLGRKKKWIPSPAECQWCGETFTNEFTPTAVYCSKWCSRKVHRIRRRTREAQSFGEWRWSDFMRMAAKFNYCCAYCGEKPERLDPDHVVPLSQGGPNIIGNLLPACAACNCDKQAYSLDVWAESRAARSLPPRRTSWAPEDRRYYHLTVSLRT